jgi:hypothetical protein
MTSVQAQRLILNKSSISVKEGSMNFLRGETKIKVLFDYSDLMIDGISEKDFVKARVRRFGEEWGVKWENTTKKWFNERFLAYTNGKLAKSKLRLAEDAPDANYQAIVKYVIMDDDNDTRLVVEFTKVNSTEVLARIALYGSAGSFGSMVNLVGDALKKAGECFGKFLDKNWRKQN